MAVAARILPPVVLTIVIALILGTRLAGPHDLYEKDQPKTMAYTADIVLNGRFSLPRDVIYQPATKPPLYNWIDAVFVRTTGRWDEWVLKLPSLLGAIATGAMVYLFGRNITARPGRLSDQAAQGESPDAPNRLPAHVGALAASIWFTFGSDVRHGSVIRLAYLARPDMLQCAFLTGAWALATVAIRRLTTRSAAFPAIGFWLCVAAAALTKGPAAIMPVIYAAVFALLAPTDGPRWRNLLKLWPMVGIPILLAGVGTWLLLAYRQDPDHVRSVIFGAEMMNRVIDKSPEGFAKPRYYEAMWFVTKALPWGFVALAALLLPAVNRSFRDRVLPASVYLIVVLACLSLPAGQRMDYLLPAYAPAAVLIAALAAFAIERLPQRLTAIATIAVLLIPLLLAGNLAHRFLRHFHESTEHYSDRAVAFTRAVQDALDPARAAPLDVLVIVRGKHPLTTLLGEHPGSYLTREQLKNAEFVVAPLQPDWPLPLLISEPLPVGFETLETRKLERLGLYAFPPGTAPLDRLIELQKSVGTWTADENPYHAPNTVYRD